MDNVVSTQQMESLKALSDTNLKVSEAKNLLFKLQEQETDYLIVREKKVMDRIKKTVEDSQELVKTADANHAQIKELSVGISQFVQDLLKIQNDFINLYAEFEERNVEWEKDIGRQQDELSEIRKEQKVVQIQLANDRKNLESGQKQLENGQKKLNSDRGTLERAINRLKERRI